MKLLITLLASLSLVISTAALAGGHKDKSQKPDAAATEAGRSADAPGMDKGKGKEQSAEKRNERDERKEGKEDKKEKKDSDD